MQEQKNAWKSLKIYIYKWFLRICPLALNLFINFALHCKLTSHARKLSSIDIIPRMRLQENKSSPYPLAPSLHEKWERSNTLFLVRHLHCRGQILVNDLVRNLRPLMRFACTLCSVLIRGFNSFLKKVTATKARNSICDWDEIKLIHTMIKFLLNNTFFVLTPHKSSLPLYIPIEK